MPRHFNFDAQSKQQSIIVSLLLPSIELYNFRPDIMIRNKSSFTYTLNWLCSGYIIELIRVIEMLGPEKKKSIKIFLASPGCSPFFCTISKIDRSKVGVLVTYFTFFLYLGIAFNYFVIFFFFIIFCKVRN